jgi:hypothetical protein
VSPSGALARLRQVLEQILAALQGGDVAAVVNELGRLRESCAALAGGGWDPAELELVREPLNRCLAVSLEARRKLEAELKQAGASRRATSAYRLVR